MLDRFAVGCVFFFLVSPGFICAAFTLRIIHRTPGLEILAVYRIIYQLVLVEFTLLTCHLLTTVMTFMNSDYGFWPTKIIGGLTLSLDICAFLLNFVLAFNRFYVYWTEGSSTSMIYKFDSLAWVNITPTSSLMEFTLQVEKILALGSIALELLCYVGIFSLVLKKRLLTSKSIMFSHVSTVRSIYVSPF
ncbi:hypothetical protein L596_016475 [Steinernema carpocapsae]|uniref:7TM GPCR serpentine receptor class x (Srx) domain-containing protein n=1 Tax=Steinernema carpocapsae TaxID=34508 RepID=A0A4U5NIV7_STECR|nr:hypothetical protein L596_016475 [Steinernema carpocapsae]